MILPPHVLKCIAPEDRKALGKAGLTPEEVLAKAQLRNERDLQRTIVSLLRLKGIEPLWHRTDKRSHATIGWPDITFSTVHRVDGWDDFCPQAWEVKFEDGELSVEQQQMMIRLQSPPNGWRVRVIRSVNEAIEQLREVGIR